MGREKRSGYLCCDAINSLHFLFGTIFCFRRLTLSFKMIRRVAIPICGACAITKTMTTIAAADKPSSGDRIFKGLQISGGLISVAGVIGAAGYALHTVDAKLLVMEERMAGVKETITKEVDAKVAGNAKELDAKVAGLAKEVDAKMAGVKESVSKEVAGVSDKAKAEALMVLKDYGVSNGPLPMASMATIWGHTVMNGFHVPPHLPFPLSIPSTLLSYLIYYRCLWLVVWRESHRASSDKERQKQVE